MYDVMFGATEPPAVEDKRTAMETLGIQEGMQNAMWRWCHGDAHLGDGLTKETAKTELEHVFSVYFWHSEGWTPRSEALLEALVKQAKTNRHPWLAACDANMCPEDFEKSLWFRGEWMHVVAPNGVHMQVKRLKQ